METKQINQKIPEQTIKWLDEEAKELNTQNNAGTTYEKLPALKLSENVVAEIKIDFSKPFQKWNTTNTKGQPITKAILPVEHEGEKKIFWVNVRNPIYSELVTLGRAGFSTIKITQIGTQAATRYVILK